MALSSLTSLGNSAPGAGYYTEFIPPIPGRLTQGELEDQVSFGLLGYTNLNQNVVVFSVTLTTYTTATLSLNADGSAVIVEDLDGSNSLGYTSYYSVDLGENSVTGGGWNLTFNAELKDKKTGTWVFVKSSTDPEGKPY